MSLLGKVHVMRVYMDLATSPVVTDNVAVQVTVDFTSDKCQSAYIISHPVQPLRYDVSSVTKELIT
jgi:hypothetical protein